MALGAAPGRVVRDVLGDGLRLVGLGIAIGLVAAFVVTRWMGSMLVGVPATDPATFGAVAAALSAAALLACWIPALSAARTDPATALRSE
jgi:ABC-type antimicrobial peptide transport system permease subunit